MNEAPTFFQVAKAYCVTNNLSNLEYVGKGAFKETYKVTTTSNQYIALKVVNPEMCDPFRTEREINAMIKCNSPLIGKLLQIENYSFSKQDKYLIILEEYFDGGNLSRILDHGSIKLADTRNYGKYLSSALTHLRDLQLVHRDIKPDNIMFQKNSEIPHLVDFGLVRDLSQFSLTLSMLPQGPGTPLYSAPEQLNNNKNMIDWRTDQFAVGIVLSMCLIGRHPFQVDGMNSLQTISAVAARESCSSFFYETMNDLGCQNIIKMVQPWPIHRYQNIDELIESFS